ncbi:MAG TPA: tetratricopeptide repeat protein [Vicinamibacteria bacterium]|jgi:tetratricopeptide (TPR) repeat protein
MNALAILLVVIRGLPGLGAATPSELEESGRSHLYNMEIASARDVFSELDRSSPLSPAGPYYEATALWMEEFSRRGGMTGATFRTGQYWFWKKVPPAPELDREFKRLMRETISRADRILEKDPGNLDGLFFRGSAEGLLSAYLASVEYSYYGAYQAGKRAKEYHERLLGIDPDYADACLLPGIFEYTLATLPRSLRILGFVLGIKGSKEKGLSLVERAVAHGNRTRWVARLSLSVIHERERRYLSSLEVLSELETAFPRNPFLPMERGSVHLLRKDWAAARRAFEEVLTKQTEIGGRFALLEPSLVFLRLGESRLFAKDPVGAARDLERALEIPGAPDWIRAQVFLRRGMTSDARGLRPAAESDYRRVVRLDVDPQTSGLAKKYLDEPYK